MSSRRIRDPVVVYEGTWAGNSGTEKLNGLVLVGPGGSVHFDHYLLLAVYCKETVLLFNSTSELLVIFINLAVTHLAAHFWCQRKGKILTSKRKSRQNYFLRLSGVEPDTFTLSTTGSSLNSKAYM